MTTTRRETTLFYPADFRNLAQFTRHYFAMFYSWKATQWERRPWQHSARWDGGIYKGRRYSSIWQKLIPFMQEQNLPVIEYMFYTIVARDLFELLQPNVLLSPKRVDAFTAWRGRLRDRQIWMRNDFQIQVRHAESELSWFEEYREPTRPLSADTQWEIVMTNIANPVFRYLLAAGEKRFEAMHDVRGSAELLYVTEPDVYDGALGDLLPMSFVTTARRRFQIASSG